MAERWVTVGWRMADFPTDGSDGATFLRQITDTLDLIHGKFDATWVADHVVPWASWQVVETPALECWTTISFLAARYPELTWGPIVLCQSNRNPALLAKMVAQFCAFLPGKFIFGIGAGWKEDEYRAYNWPFPKASVRIHQLEETVEIAKRLWREDDVTYEGQHYRVEHAYLDPKPDPIPPILIGGSGEQLTLRVVAKHADWWNGGGTMENYRHKLDVLRQHCDAVGRDFAEIECSIDSSHMIRDTEEEARSVLESIAAANGRPAPDPTSTFHWVGSPEQVAERMAAYAELGFTTVTCSVGPPYDEETLTRLIREVKPLAEAA